MNLGDEAVASLRRRLLLDIEFVNACKDFRGLLCLRLDLSDRGVREVLHGKNAKVGQEFEDALEVLLSLLERDGTPLGSGFESAFTKG
ncbi:hypothetical protein PROAA_770007 [Candidatus Propionivibrio aalborgensis]|uniref:Uncharacterized protein n=1 Tax=Candidatus Propionivibrio aalborgensis TaxID=1860101 RepID=A0A1A8Y181_9RHOO|nr:hypothetical protein PROAA_770007 [Candidatus Propionivibrio aalborgensis]